MSDAPEACVLAIDTSADTCAVALLCGERHWSRVETMTRGHAEALIPMIEEVLAEAGAMPRDLDRIAVATGPGSFTGVRAGVAAARGMALGLGIPSIGVTRLEAIAFDRGGGEVAIPLRGDDWAVQEFTDATTPAERPRIEARGAGGAPVAVDPVTIARLGAMRQTDGRAAPLYLRPPDAAPGADVPPPILD